MWDFSSDEWVFFIAAAAIVGFGSVRYYGPLITYSSMRKRGVRRAVLAMLPVVAVIPTCVVLLRWADSRVVGHLDYAILFMLGAGAWIFVASRFIQVLGISIRDDALERDNPAALIAVCGILLGVGIVYTLSNIGAGPTIWTTILPALAATVLLVFMSLLIELTGKSVAEAITIDRDVATGLRLAGAMLGCAIILGCAAVGDWTSWKQTWVDLAIHGWPAVVLAVAAGVMQWRHRPTADRPTPDIVAFGVIPAALFIAAGSLVAFTG